MVIFPVQQTLNADFSLLFFLICVHTGNETTLRCCSAFARRRQTTELAKQNAKIHAENINTLAANNTNLAAGPTGEVHTPQE